VWVAAGAVSRSQTFNALISLTLQLHDCETGAACIAQLVSENVCRSNFDQMFVLGRWDVRLFDEVENAWPVPRLFRLRSRLDSARALE
jgi:hypothetical protein